MTLQPTGELTANVVTILGGSDVAEPYNVAEFAGIKPVPGMLVCIDDGKIGQMRVAGRAYDSAVAGIISGANGIAPGITLRQKGTIADGSLPVASIGRVWALVRRRRERADCGGRYANYLGHARTRHESHRPGAARRGRHWQSDERPQERQGVSSCPCQLEIKRRRASRREELRASHSKNKPFCSKNWQVIENKGQFSSANGPITGNKGPISLVNKPITGKNKPFYSKIWPVLWTKGRFRRHEEPVKAPAPRKKEKDKMKLWKTGGLLLCLTALQAGLWQTPAGAQQNTDLYVDGCEGNDSVGDGSSANPFQTVTMALDAVPAGVRWTIHIRGGNIRYSETPRITKKVRLINWGNSGQARIGAPAIPCGSGGPGGGNGGG